MVVSMAVRVIFHSFENPWSAEPFPTQHKLLIGRHCCGTSAAAATVAVGGLVIDSVSNANISYFQKERKNNEKETMYEQLNGNNLHSGD